MPFCSIECSVSATSTIQEFHRIPSWISHDCDLQPYCTEPASHSGLRTGSEPESDSISGSVSVFNRSRPNQQRFGVVQRSPLCQHQLNRLNALISRQAILSHPNSRIVKDPELHSPQKSWIKSSSFQDKHPKSELMTPSMCGASGRIEWQSGICNHRFPIRDFKHEKWEAAPVTGRSRPEPLSPGAIYCNKPK